MVSTLPVYYNSNIPPNEPLGSNSRIEVIPPPNEPLDTKEPMLKEVKEVVKKARSGSAPGSNGVTYKVYKKCP